MLKVPVFVPGEVNQRKDVRIYWNKRRGVYKICHAPDAVLIRGRWLFASLKRQTSVLTTVLLFSVLNLLNYRFDAVLIRGGAYQLFSPKCSAYSSKYGNTNRGHEGMIAG